MEFVFQHNKLETFKMNDVTDLIICIQGSILYH